MSTTQEARLQIPTEPMARRATLADAKIKLFAWGESGSGKSRLALSFPNPLVCDLEKSTNLYAGEFNFLVCEPRPDFKAHQLVYALVEQIKREMYPEVETFVIDPITDYIDALEQAMIEKLAKRGVNIAALTGLNKSKAYSEINDGIRAELDKILALPLHVVFVCRAKNLWGKNADGKMDVLGRQPDCKEIVPYLSDVILNLERGGTAIVEKSRLGELGARIPSMTFAHIQQALGAAQAKAPEAVPTKRGKATTKATTEPPAAEDGNPWLEPEQPGPSAEDIAKAASAAIP